MSVEPVYHSAGTGTGRATVAGHSTPSGQLSENHCIARSKRLVVTSVSPATIASSFLPSLKMRDDRVFRGMSFAAENAPATTLRPSIEGMANPVLKPRTGFLTGFAPARKSVNCPAMKKAVRAKRGLKTSVAVGPDRLTFGGRIRKRLAAGDMSASFASQEMGHSEDFIRNILRKEANGTPHHSRADTLRALASVLGTSPEWLTTGVGREDIDDMPQHLESEAVLMPPPPVAGGARAVLRGYVGAGSAAHYYALSDDEYEAVDPFPGSDRQQVALEIKGKSWGALMERWLVYYDDIRSPITDDLLNRPCVVGLADDRVLIKSIKREADGSFSLLSNNTDEPPMRDVEIDWAAPVLGFRPKT